MDTKKYTVTENLSAPKRMRFGRPSDKTEWVLKTYLTENDRLTSRLLVSITAQLSHGILGEIGGFLK